MSDDRGTELSLEKAREIGFDPVGVCRAVPAATFSAYAGWLDAKMHGDTSASAQHTTDDADRGMSYLLRHREARRHPESLLPGVKSLVVVGLAYESVNPGAAADVRDAIDSAKRTSERDGLFGIVAGYARGGDYHDAMRNKLRQLAETHRRLFPDAKTRIAVDTAPILEREYALRAGLGWPGKNTMLINDRLGSRFFLGTILSTAPLCETGDDPFLTMRNDSPCRSPEGFSFCGDCRRCVDACPTGALATPFRLDARKCLNYWSIEYKGDGIPPEIADRFGRRLFGCDTCQRVCPFNKTAPPQREASPSHAPIDPATTSLREQLESGVVSLAQIESLDEAEFQRQFAGTPLIRLGLERLKRNAAIVRRNAERPPQES